MIRPLDNVKMQLALYLFDVRNLEERGAISIFMKGRGLVVVI
jgi:hypothetical protein